MTREIDYGKLMHNAMRGLIQEVLSGVREHGLPGAHHFFITFDTTHDGVEIAPWLRQRYPTEMTVVLQHWFDNLQVDDAGFAVTLNFGDMPERLRIPYDAIKTFVDPSVEFGLRFESHDEEAPADASEDAAPGDEAAGLAADVAPEDDNAKAEVVSLDSFRK